MILTTAQAAALTHRSPEGFRRWAHRERTKGRDYRLPQDQWPDKRTPLWDGEALKEWRQK